MADANKKERDKAIEVGDAKDGETESEQCSGKRKRGRPTKKEAEEKEKDRSRMRSYLENGKVNSFEILFGKSRPLEHSPVGAREKKDGKEESNVSGSSTERKISKEEGAREEGGGKKTEGEYTATTAREKETAEKEDGQRNQRGERVGAGCSGNESERRWEEWSERMNGRMREVECRLGKVTEEKRELENEVKNMYEQICRDRCLIEKMREEIEAVRTRSRVNEAKIVELGLEREIAGREMSETEWEKEKKRGKGVGGEDASNNNNLERKMGKGENSEEGERRSYGSAGSGADDEEEIGERNSGTTREREQEKEKAVERIVEREYLKNVPDALGASEYECEMEERKRRKKNILMRGIRTVGKGVKEEIKYVLWERLGIRIYIKKIIAGGGGLIIECESFENKVDIMRKKGLLKGTGIWIDDDYTEREKQIQSWLDSIVEEEGRNGLAVKIGYMKINIDRVWYKWDEKIGQIIELTFRGERARQ